MADTNQTTDAVEEIETPPTEEQTQEITPEPIDILAQLNERLGTDYKSLDELKPKPAEETEEERNRKLTQKEQKALNKYIEKGGSIEKFATLKQISLADPKEFSISDLKQELAQAGFDKDEIEEEIKSRYYLLSEDEKAELTEDDQALLKKHEFFSKKLEKRAVYKQDDARSYLKALESEVEAEELLAQTDANISSKVDEIARTMERKVTVELGKSNDVELAPVTFDISDDDISETLTLLKNPTKRNEFLYNQDGSENIENIFEALKWKSIATKLAKKAAVDAANEQVEIFMSKYSGSPYAIAPGNVAKNNLGGKVGKAIEGTEQTVFRTTR